MVGRRVGVAFGVIMLVLLAGGATALSSDGASPAPTQAPVYDPAQAPVIFLPGLVASELSCNPGTPGGINLWPGEATRLEEWPIATLFPALGQVNVNSRGGIITRDVSSAQCGSQEFRGGTVAASPVEAVSAQWCSPEAVGPINPLPHPCTVPKASVVYGTFGLALQDQIALDAGGQLFASYPWDWRRSPADQVSELDRLVTLLTVKTGVKATIVAHSFGNLLMREWLRFVESRGQRPGDRVGRFLSVAGPWLGVATAWEHLAYGSIQPNLAGDVLSDTIGRATVRSVMSSNPGLYWLLPSKAFDDYLAAQPDTAGESWLAVGRHRGRGVWVPFAAVPRVVANTLDTCPESRTFPCQARALYQAGIGNASPVTFDGGGIQDFVGVVGAGVSTAVQFCDRCLAWPDGGTDGSSELDGGAVPHLTRNGSGDGNVPVFSATFGQNGQPTFGPIQQVYFTCGVDHLSLMQVPDVLAQTIPYLTGDAALSYGTVFTSEPCAFTSTRTD